jgi:tetratricopeptide (TPR) repeat protein
MKNITKLILLISLLACSTENWESLKTKTENALNNKDYSKALEYLEEAVFKEPHNAEVHYFLGQTYRLMLFADGSIINNVNMHYASKSSNHFKKVIEISPDYTGKKFVVGPYSKIQSIWGSVAMTYLYNNNPDSATWAFQLGKAEGGFYPAIMEYNKNIMASCEKNAILFTNGDNDTYPMWFLQLLEKYRTDITVVNLSLLNVPWYIKQLKHSYPFGENNLIITITDAEIDSIKPILWKEKMVRISVKDDPLNNRGKIEWLVKPTIDDKAVRVQDLMLIEILKSNDWKRPVYFSTTVYKGNTIDLDNYLNFEGLVYRLNSHKAKTSTEKLSKNLTEVYTYDGVNDKHLSCVNEMLSIYQNYRHTFITLATLYADAGRKDKVTEVLRMMNECLPESLLPYTNEELREEADELYKRNL